MKRKLLSLFTISMITFALVGCGVSGVNEEIGAIEPEKQLINVVEEGTTTEDEDGNLVVKTDSGETINLDGAEVTENEDGSKTYTTDDGKEVTVEDDGDVTITTEEEVVIEEDEDIDAPSDHTHSYTSVVTKTATCTEKGVKTFTCSCGSSYTKDIEALGHKAGDWVVTKNATCNAEGIKVKNCSTCGTQIENTTIAKTTTHTPGDWIVTKEATCSAQGSKHKVCTVCGIETAVEVIAKSSSHTYAWSHVSAGDYKTNVCTGCGAESGTKAYNLGNGIYGYYDDNAALELFNSVNAQRNIAKTNIYDEDFNVIDTVNIPSLVWGYDSIAKQRALEIVSDFSHNGLKTNNENIAAGQSDAITVSINWSQSPGHAQSMLSIDYVYGSTACLWVDSDGRGTMYPYWVLVLSIQ